MKKFFIKILIFISPIVVLSIPLDYFISKNLAKSKTFAGGEISIWTAIYEGRINSDMVIYGSSRAWVHINPSTIEDSLKISTYNLGLDGHNFWLQYLRHKEYLKYNKKPKQIIQVLDESSLEKHGGLFNLEQFLPYMLWNKDIYAWTSSYIGYSWWDYNVPLARYIAGYAPISASYKGMLSVEPSEPVRIKGYLGTEKEWNDDLEKAKKVMEYYEVKIDSSTENLFVRFLRECKEDTIDVILVCTPEHIEGQNFIKNRKELLSLYQSYADKNHIRFLDYSKDELCFQKKYFYNASHLNKIGSELFTAKLIQDIKRKNIPFGAK